jgi:hypothetical protein
MSRRKTSRITLDNADALFQRDAVNVIGRLTAYTRRWYGERCRDYEPECACCAMWQAVRLVTENGP